MFKHIVVTLDGSSYGERVLPYVSDLANLAEARVTLLAILPEEPVIGAADPGGTDGAASKRAEVARAYLDQHATPLREAGVGDVAVEVRSGVPARAIVDTAREVGADLIAMSTQGVGAETEQGLGGVASKVLMLAPCPVFMVRVQRPAPPKNPAEERWQAEGGANVG